MLTDNAQRSVWVSKEVERAVSYKKPIIPLQFDNVKLNDEFEFYISTDQIVAVQKIDEDLEEIHRVVSAVTAYTGVTAGGSSFSPPSVPRPIKKDRGMPFSTKLWIGIAAGIAVLGVILFLVGWLSGNINW